MKKSLWQLGAILTVVLFQTSCKKDLPECSGPKVTVKVFATGLNNPRGLKFGPDGYLYVAEGGTGGSNITTGQCTQVPFPVGPYKGSPTGGGISKISGVTGERVASINTLPSSQANEIVGGSVEGVSDVAFVNNTLYALLAGAGCSHGVPSLPNGVVQVKNDGTWKLVADISTYLKANPVKNPEEDDFEPDGTPYSMINVNGNLYAIEPNHGELIKITPDGKVSRVVDISATQGHIVPTAVVYHNGYFYVGNLNTFPIVAGSAKVFRISMSGDIQVWATGFTTILGLAFDNKDRLYVLENTAISAPNPMPNQGKIVRVNASGEKETITTLLSLPTAITYGPDGKLYVSNIGFGPASIGGGQVVQIDVKDCGCNDFKWPTANNR